MVQSTKEDALQEHIFWCNAPSPWMIGDETTTGTMGYHGISWDIMGYHGISWDIGGVRSMIEPLFFWMDQVAPF